MVLVLVLVVVVVVAAQRRYMHTRRPPPARGDRYCRRHPVKRDTPPSPPNTETSNGCVRWRTSARRPQGLRVLHNRRLGICREPPDRRQAPPRDAASQPASHPPVTTHQPPMRAINYSCHGRPRKLPNVRRRAIIVCTMGGGGWMGSTTTHARHTSRSFRAPPPPPVDALLPCAVESGWALLLWRGGDW